MLINNYLLPAAKLIVFRKRSEQKQAIIREKRLRDIIEYARNNSKYYANVIPENWHDITDIPMLDKETLINHFDDIVTDSRITLDMVKEKMNSVPADGRLLKDYIITRTSGSSGKPTVVIHDANSVNNATMVGFIRGIKNNFPLATITSESEFSIEGEATRHNHRASPLMKKMLISIDSEETPEKIAQILLEKQPKAIVGYSSIVRILSGTIIEKQYEMKCEKIFLSGEEYNEADKKMIKKAFPHAEVLGIYGCTEGGVIAYECECGHLHINSDLFLLEPVDKKGNVLPYGKTSDQALLTCFANKVQPLIRYQLGDKITLHQGCLCGIKDDWVEIQGRTNDILPFENDGKTTHISPMDILCIMGKLSEDGLKKFKNYQMVFHKPNKLEVRLACFENTNKQQIFEEIKNSINRFLKTRGVSSAEMYLSDAEPKRTTSNGKHKRVYIEK